MIKGGNDRLGGTVRDRFKLLEAVLFSRLCFYALQK